MTIELPELFQLKNYTTFLLGIFKTDQNADQFLSLFSKVKGFQTIYIFYKIKKIIFIELFDVQLNKI